MDQILDLYFNGQIMKKKKHETEGKKKIEKDSR
jgi:hypothetical protein